MRPPWKFTRIALLIAATALAAACSQESDGAAVPAGNDERAAMATETASGGRPEPGPAAPRPELASQDVTLEGVDLHVAVHELARRGRLAELTFSVTRTDDKKENWQVGQTFGGSTQSKSSLSVSGVELLDTVNGKLHTVALDQEDNCVCTAGTESVFLDAGDVILFSATYAAPPENVPVMGVRIPKVGTFNDVPLS
ncbi:hypothetical protein [Pseudonocardia sp. MH-G8]|uniref:hypothetical protein n=1 Tax=Pseudonocardia sp. MH-G8 TaxID=1854588 RepID=UPI000B9FE472|nr:hypothetical protein [Pseudonocardia sp. MH-G8]OZM80802.1 hypothetical protein CFP66_18880 [Pseudonocardia sp. MH-G8]